MGFYEGFLLGSCSSEGAGEFLAILIFLPVIIWVAHVIKLIAIIYLAWRLGERVVDKIKEIKAKNMAENLPVTH